MSREFLPCNFPVSLGVHKDGVWDEVAVHNLGIVMTELKSFSKLTQSFLNLVERRVWQRIVRML